MALCARVLLFGTCTKGSIASRILHPTTTNSFRFVHGARTWICNPSFPFPLMSNFRRFAHIDRGERSCTPELDRLSVSRFVHDARTEMSTLLHPFKSSERKLLNVDRAVMCKRPEQS